MGRIFNDINNSEQAPVLFKDNNLWDRQPGETRVAFSVFCAYRDAAPGYRSMEHVRKATGKFSAHYIYTLSSKHKWAMRITAWEAHLDKKRQEAKLKEIEDMARRHSQHAQAVETALLIPVDKFINKYRQDPTAFDNMTVGDLLALVYQSADRFPKIVDTERKSRGVPTDITKTDITSDGQKIEPAINILINGSESPLLKEMLKSSE